jgi:hypothetical protein
MTEREATIHEVVRLLLEVERRLHPGREGSEYKACVLTDLHRMLEGSTQPYDLNQIVQKVAQQEGVT